MKLINLHKKEVIGTTDQQIPIGTGLKVGEETFVVAFIAYTKTTQNYYLIGLVG